MSLKCYGKIFRFLLMMLITVLLISACTTTGQMKRPEKRENVPAANAPRVDESFDPVTLGDDNLSFPDAKMPESLSSSATSENKEQNQPAPTENRQVEGFRIQLFATSDIEKATLQKKEAEYEFASDSVVVYIEFASPLYKVRAGDCRSRDESLQLLNLAKQKGYPTSFIVKTKVNTIPQLSRDLFENDVIEQQ